MSGIKGNPILDLIQSVPWEYGDIVCDYQVGLTTGLLFLSLRYHKLHPDYLHTRINKLGQNYNLRILLVLCDVDDHEPSIREITKVTVINRLTIFIAWSNAEAARYIQLFKSFERKPPDLIKERTDQTYLTQLSSVLTTVNGLNKTDVLTLASSFGSFRNLTEASSTELSRCPGLGEKKVNRLIDSFNSTFGPPNKSRTSNNQPGLPSKDTIQDAEALDLDLDFEE
ncbi:hypothetical protein CROQUDRAFT_129742 [Cronartium quercuum f. sp. fusiforme G11]|uniref:DNA excision repair protein ERCC-1 n=1 Tax=Cronartium quercuum f. sp. fusiforme G11 TaxID=708437 RepID=A0A9P6NWZ8_9BASI|nr:hypothetical protein CROQUDRAFT_129742 [Cronartium quercuum f. sp. fusiforme G11]